jgi:hypothetical protein
MDGTTGYCGEVFDYCSPSVVIISDKEIVHDTQKNVHGDHATGILWSGGPERRYVLTTRSDGMIAIKMNAAGGYHVTVG